ncbi:hypothetical protein DU506_14280 [Vreelandella rituensis]|uniref:Uncharacterized protein n=2 Tax=Vreelandella rituensis TaxID=2282306 RepID=A0A368TVM2_9GAMM|nr:hypothetical protein DU506_14280 [Halomonas rituensis]
MLLAYLRYTESNTMTTQTLSHSTPATAPEASLIKRISQAACRLFERMIESAYRRNDAHLLKHFYI